ncbi:MAG: TonB-dependent receptor, partial [Acidobacteriales bacterium]|nr:TonB-dependent receptor [Terriglobales bacterium]
MVCVLHAACAGAWAQAAGSGTIRGSVVDPQQRVIPGAQVTVRSNDFNTTRSLLSDASGDFVTPLLPAGTYTVKVEAAGFAPRTLSKVNLSVGSTIHLSVKLQLPQASEQVTVTGRAPTVEGNTVPPEVNKQEVETGNFFAGLTVTYLPNRDRDFTQFAQLSAGTVESGAGQGAGLSIAGQRSTALNVEVDGMSFRDPLRGGARGSDDNSLFFPQTVVREFEVVRSGATAEVGNTNAGLVNVLTKSGSNKFHGEGFYIGRPSALSSRDTFDHSLDNAQNEFGGSFGGPIRRDRAFYYFGAEQDFVNLPYWTQFQPQAPGTVLPANLLAQQQQNVGKSDPTALFGRLDFVLTPRNSLNLQLNYNRIHNTGFTPDNSTRTDAAFDNSLDLVGHSVWARGGLVTSFGAGTVNQVLAQWAVDQRDFRPRSLSPEIVINGFGRLGGNSTYPDQTNSQRRQVSDDIALYRRGLLIQFGGVFAYDPLNQQREANLNGRFDFNSLADYENDLPRRYQQTFVTGDATFDGAIRELGLYVNLKAPIHPGLTLSAGLRWQGQWNPQPGNGNPAIPQTTSIPNDPAQWQPRLGLAWNPAKNSVLRLAAGLYDSPTPGNVFQRVFTDNGRNTTVVDSYFDPQVLPLGAGQLGTGLSAPPVGLTLPQALVVGIAPDFRNPRSSQTSASLE